MRKHLCLWLVGGVVAFTPALAHAEDEPKAYPECTKAPTDSETAAAKGAYQAGNASFDEADYPRSITYWEDAYRRDCTANLLLKNLARAYELYGQKRQAVVALETFLVREPSSSDKDQIQRRIEVLKKQIAENAAPVAAAQPTQPVALAATPVEQQPETGATAKGARPIAPLIVAGAGAVVLVVGLAIVVKGASDVKDFEAACPKHMCPNKTGTTEGAAARDALISQGNDARNKERLGGIVAGVGGAVLAGGLIWYVVQPRSAARSTATLLHPRVTPSVTPGFAGLSLSGAF